jgi:HTH-type transcriptional regulator, sugar sensing transcriptional regulator
MKDIVPILRSLGLLDSEVKTYMTALEKGAGTVLDFSKHTRLSRQAIYVAIESLTERGLMSSALHGKKRFYAAEHPDKLLAYAERREQEMKERIHDLKRALPEIELQMGGEKPVVKVFEGKEGLKAVLAEIQRMGSAESVEITDVDAMKNVLSQADLQPIHNELHRKQVHNKGIYASKNPSPSMVKGDRYYLPPHISNFKANIGIYEDKIALVTFEGKMYSVLIESKALSKTLRLLFDLAFKGVSSS